VLGNSGLSAGESQRQKLDRIPEGTRITSIRTGAGKTTVSFSNSAELDFPAQTCACLSVSEDGFWQLNGKKTAYKFASEEFMTLSSDGMWLCNGEKTGKRAVPKQPKKDELSSLVISARRVTANFTDGSSRVFEKQIEWGMYVEKTEKNIYIYMGRKGSGDWVRYQFFHRFKNTSNPASYPNKLDNWGLGLPARCTFGDGAFTLPEEAELFIGGEAEAAVQVDSPNGKMVYTGGVHHGWENILSDESGKRLISIRIDGKEISEGQTMELTEASRVEIEQHTRIAKAYGDPVTDQYAVITKKWVLADGTVSIRNQYDFTSDININQAMFGMVCVKRLDQPDPQYKKDGPDLESGYVTRFAWKDNDPCNMYKLEEGWEKKEAEGFNERSYKVFRKKDPATRRVEEYGDKGWTFAIQLDEGAPEEKGGFCIGTNKRNYNKIYLDICGKCSKKAGETLSSTVRWEIDRLSDNF